MGPPTRFMVGERATTKTGILSKTGGDGLLVTWVRRQKQAFHCPLRTAAYRGTEFSEVRDHNLRRSNCNLFEPPLMSGSFDGIVFSSGYHIGGAHFIKCDGSVISLTESLNAGSLQRFGFS